VIGGVLSISMLAEMFPTPVRGTGLGLTAGLAMAIVGGTAPLVDQILFRTTGLELAPAGYVAAVAAIAGVTLWPWPETAFKDLDPEVSRPPR
jgi:MFS transporter, MHS family, proline/betaine transporter